MEKDHPAGSGLHLELKREVLAHLLIFANLLWAGQEDRPREVRNLSQVRALGKEQGFP